MVAQKMEVVKWTSYSDPDPKPGGDSPTVIMALNEQGHSKSGKT